MLHALVMSKHAMRMEKKILTDIYSPKYPLFTSFIPMMMIFSERTTIPGINPIGATNPLAQKKR
jgi:hypothetical protein